MESAPSESAPLGNPSPAFAESQKVLQARVNAAAEAILDQGLKPTVTRVRAAMGGGSPNDIGPALKHWKEVLLPTLGRSVPTAEGTAVPSIVSDVVRELWSRALAAAKMEIRGGASGRLEISQGEQVHLLRQEVASLRDRLQREAQAYGELRAQSARHEVIAKDALSRAADLENRLQRSQQALGEAHARTAELTARTQAPKPPKTGKRTARPPSRKTRRSKPRHTAAVRGAKRSKTGRVTPRKSRRGRRQRSPVTAELRRTRNRATA